MNSEGYNYPARYIGEGKTGADIFGSELIWEILSPKLKNYIKAPNCKEYISTASCSKFAISNSER